jgi:two-component system, NarL family, invasion response regulator UvrY
VLISPVRAAVADVTPRLVVMDVKMPGMGGLAATRRLLARRPETVVVLVSVDECDSEQVLSAGAAAFIRKQRLSSRLLRQVREAARDASLPPE